MRNKNLTRIAYLIDTISSNKAGTEKQLLEIIQRLDREIFDPCLICLYEAPWLKNNSVHCPVHVLSYQGLFKYSFPGVVRRLARLLREQHVDIVQTFFEDAIFVGWIGSTLSRTYPVLLSSRRDIGLGEDDLWYHALFKAALPFVNRYFDGILANAESVRTFTARREKTPLSKIAVIPNGIELPSDASARPALFEEVPADLWIGITANLKPVKRLDLFIRALAVFQNTCPVNYHAVILGEGSQENMLKQLAKDLGLDGRVHFVGSVANVYAYLKHIDIGVLCSDREGLSNSIMEYMASSLPVVATSVGGNVELVCDMNGIIVPPGDVISLGKALVQLAQNPERRSFMGQASRERILKNYTWGVIIEQLQKYYQDTLFIKRKGCNPTHNYC